MLLFRVLTHKLFYLNNLLIIFGDIFMGKTLLLDVKKIWELHQAGKNNTQISQEIGINRTEISIVLKYTTAQLYGDISSTIALQETEETLTVLRDENKKLTQIIDDCSDAYSSVLPFKKYAYLSLVTFLLCGFFLGGFTSRKMMNSLGYYTTIEDIFSPYQ